MLSRLLGEKLYTAEEIDKYLSDIEAAETAVEVNRTLFKATLKIQDIRCDATRKIMSTCSNLISNACFRETISLEKAKRIARKVVKRLAHCRERLIF